MSGDMKWCGCKTCCKQVAAGADPVPQAIRTCNRHCTTRGCFLGDRHHFNIGGHPAKKAAKVKEERAAAKRERSEARVADEVSDESEGEDGERTDITTPPGGRAHVTLPKNVVAPRVVKATAAAAAAMVRPRAGRRS